MRLACYADLHGALPKVPPCDLVLLAGDLGPDGDLFDKRAWVSRELRPWLDSQHAPVVAVAGNHDDLFAVDPSLSRRMPWTYLVDEAATVAGLRIYGIPWTPSDIDRHWYAGPPRMERHAVGIPPGLDILLLHAAPAGFGDRMNHDCAVSPSHCGSLAIKEAVRLQKPRLVLFGHNHEGRGCWSWNGSLLVNVTSGHNGSRSGRGRAHKPFGWWLLDWDQGPQLLDGEETLLPYIPGLYLYNRVGIGTRHLQLNEDGTISRGQAGCERQWRVRWANRTPGPTLIISGDREDTMFLTRFPDGVFRGRWERYERNDVELVPVRDLLPEEPLIVQLPAAHQDAQDPAKACLAIS